MVHKGWDVLRSIKELSRWNTNVEGTDQVKFLKVKSVVILEAELWYGKETETK